MEKKKFVIFSIFFLILLMIKSGYCEKKNVFTSANSPYIVQYPASWSYEVVYGIPIFNPLENGFPVAMVNLTPGILPMEILKEDYGTKNVEEALKALIESYSQPGELNLGFVLVDKGIDTIDNNKAGFIIYDLNKLNSRRKEYFFFDNGEVYSVQYDAHIKYFDKYLPEANTIMKSIKIKKNAPKDKEEERNKSSGYWDRMFMPEDQLRNIAKAAKAYYEVYSSYPDNLSVLANAEPPWIDKRLLDEWKSYEFKIIKSDKGHFIAVAMPIQTRIFDSRIFCVTEDGIVKEAQHGDSLSYEYIKTLKAVGR